MSIPQGDGPIEATSTIEAIPTTSLYPRIDTKTISAEQPYENVNNKENKQKPMIQNALETPYRQSMKMMQDEYQAPTAPPLHEINIQPKLLLNLQGRRHEFSNRTVLRTETCAQCSKK